MVAVGNSLGESDENMGISEVVSKNGLIASFMEKYVFIIVYESEVRTNFR